MKTLFLRNKTVTYFLPSFSFFLFVIYIIFNQYSYSQPSYYIDIDIFNDFLIEKGDELSYEKRYNESIKYYDKALQLVPLMILKLYIKKGLHYIGLGYYTEAIQYYDKILEIDPTRSVALDNKGKALDRLGRLDEAIQYYDKSLQIFPN